MIDMPPKEKSIEAYAFEPHGLYLVDVACNPGNPIWRAVLHVGFVRDGKPSNYSAVWRNSSDEVPFRELHYLKVIKKLATAEEMGT